MTDTELVNLLTKAAADHAALHKLAGPAMATSVYADIVAQLRALNIPWYTILSVVIKVLPEILAGQPIGAIIAAILAELTIQVPAPVNVP